MAKRAYRRVTKRCPSPRCGKTFTGHPNKRFCNLRCKDRYHNTHNPRGYGLCDDPDDERRGEFRLGPGDMSSEALGQWDG